MFDISFVARNPRRDPFSVVIEAFKCRNLSQYRCRLWRKRHWDQRHPKIDAPFRGRRWQLRRRAETWSSSLNQILWCHSYIIGRNFYLSQKRIARILSIHRTTVKHVLLEDLLLRKVNFKWISHLLNDDQKSERIRLSNQLLQFLESKWEPQLANT
jgi:hypothetical protein